MRTFTSMAAGVVRRWLAMTVMVGAMLGVGASAAAADMQLFTGDLTWGGRVFAPNEFALSPEDHSYGFHSTTNTSETARGQVIGAIDDWRWSGWEWWGIGNDLIRLCIQGTYPNCVDTDGWSATTRIDNYSGVNLRLRGHSLY